MKTKTMMIAAYFEVQIQRFRLKYILIRLDQMWLIEICVVLRPNGKGRNEIPMK